MWDKLWEFSAGYNQRFPDGNDPFQIMTRLLEECGELAQEVNLLEGSGIKREKRGEPVKADLANEVRNVLTCALQVALHYEARYELEALIEDSHQRMIVEGLAPDGR